MGTRVSVALVVLVAALATGCSDDGSPYRRDGESDDEFESRITGDDDATPAEIAAAGTKMGTYIFGDARVVVYRTSDPVDDDLPTQYAWRAFSGGTVRSEGKSMYGLKVRTVDDGILVATNFTKPYLTHVDGDARKRILTIGEHRRPTQPGDVLTGVEPSGRPVAYRPGSGAAPGSAAYLPPIEGRDLQDVRLASNGSVWVRLPQYDIEEPVLLRWSADGRKPWRTETIPVPARSYVPVQGMTVVGNEIYVFTAHGPIPQRTLVDAIWVRTATEPTGPWRRIGLAGAGFRRGDGDPSLRIDADGRIVVSNQSGSYVRDGNRFVPLPSS